MSITVANLMAQVGVDITQLKRGLNEADARVALSAKRFENAGKQVQRMTQTAQHMTERAAANDAKVVAIGREKLRLESQIAATRSRSINRSADLDAVVSTQHAAERYLATLKSSGAVYTNLTAQRATLSKAETAAATMAKRVADTQAKHAAAGMLLSTSLQKKEKEHDAAQIAHTQGLAKAQQAHADQVNKQQARVARARKVYLDEYEKNEKARDEAIAKNKDRLLALEPQRITAQHRATLMMHSEEGNVEIIAARRRAANIEKQIRDARARAVTLEQTPAALPRSSARLEEEQRKLTSLGMTQSVESPKTWAALQKAEASLRETQAHVRQIQQEQSKTVNSLQHQLALAEANKTAEASRLATLVSGNAEHAKIIAQEKVVANLIRASAAAQRELNSETTKLGTLEKQNIANSQRILSLQERSTALTRNAANITARAGESAEMSQARKEMEDAYAERKRQDATSHGIRAANALSGAAIGVGVVGLGALGVGEKAGADFNQMMVTAAHNTSLVGDQIRAMTDAVKELGAQTGAPFDELADSYRKIENIGFKDKDILTILNLSTKSSIAYGAKLSDTTQVLASSMKDFNVPASQSAKVMNILIATHKIANQDFSEMTKVFGTAQVASAAYGISLAEVGAAFATMTKYGINGHMAVVQFRNDVAKITNPTNAVKKELAEIFTKTGVNLPEVFTSATLRAKGFLYVFDQINKAADKLGANRTDLLIKLFSLQRGQLGSSILGGMGHDTFVSGLKDIRSKTADAGLQSDFAQSMGTTDRQLQIMERHLTLLAASIDQAFAPSIKRAVDVTSNLFNGFHQLNSSTQSGVIDAVAISSAVAITIGVFGKLIVGINAMRIAIAELQLQSAAGILGKGLAVGAVGVGGALVGNELRKNMGILYPGEQAEADKANAARAHRSNILGYETRGAPQLKKDLALNQSRIDKLAKQLKDAHYTGTEAGRLAYAQQEGVKILRQEDSIRGVMGAQKEALTRLQAPAPKHVETEEEIMKRLLGSSGAIGANPLAGLGSKEPKPKKAKESETQKSIEEYKNRIEELRKAEFKLLNPAMGTEELEARWETMSHGIVNVGGKTYKLAGDYVMLAQAEQRAMVVAAKHNDLITSQQEKLDAFHELLEKNRPEYTKEQDPSGTRRITEDADRGDYIAKYGQKFAAEAMESDLTAVGNRANQQLDDAKKQLDAEKAELDERIHAPQHDNDSVAYKTAQDIHKNPELAKSFGGEDKIQEYAREAQAIYDTSQSYKTYTNSLEAARDALQKLQDEGKEIGGKPQTYLDAANRSIDDRNKRKSPNWAQQIADEQLRILARRADAQKALNVQDQKAVDLKNYLTNAEEHARDAAITAANPKDKAGEYQRQAIQSYGQDKFNKEPSDKQAEILKQIANSYNKIVAPATRAAEANTIVADALKKVNEQFGQTHNTIITNINDWNKLTTAQKDYLNQLQKYSEAKQKVQDAVTGISDLISKTFDDIHEHGFRNLFRDIANEFQNMLYEMGKKEVMAQINKTLEATLVPALGRVMGVGSTAPTPPPGPASTIGSSTIGSVGTMTISNAASIDISGNVVSAADGGTGADSSGGFNPFGLFGGGSSSPSDMPGFGDFTDYSLSGSFAGGGTMFSDHSYLVGENGPEIVHPMSSGQVVPLTRGGTTVNIHVHGVQDAASFNASKHQITQDMVRAVQMAQRR